ncbi:MAG: diacylglycerol kinase family lipid kinase [Desulfarculus sp.]|nr:diacylglycerol kinase family lipid kinase [Pseudomonadota bacterium]MBV1717388.1 diacylglycerol kinase family lipid kinase [Desulfarculus sp.]MBU4573197.1 diacylglycerol kinase family lipid kinase [Pseudomonadota bacterium]MBU4598687.1 diacylglycerol kinase family lipid kinase [Pseudomonadota bacterium]MBV1739958.1 diacylglycerol kinase family lipid kinase [Desulfarculus sp.]
MPSVMPRIALIHNPQAGRGKAPAAARRLQAALAGAGLKPRELLTKGRGHAEELVSQAMDQGAEVIMVVGGDGTMHEAAQALAGSQACLAPLPAGRCNDFCRSLGLGFDAEALVAAVTTGTSRQVDLVQVNGRNYCTVGAVGFDAEVSRFVDLMKAPLWGQPAYIYAVLRTLGRYRPPEVKLTWDDGHYHGPLFLAAVANTPTYGNQIRIVPQARADDGHLDICLVRPVTIFQVMRFLPLALKGSHGSVPEVSFVRTRKVEIVCDRPVELWADGEPVASSPLKVEILPRALKVVAPA